MSNSSSNRVDVEKLRQRFLAREAVIGVIGLGYVGLPLVGALTQNGFTVVGFDIDGEKVAILNAGRSFIRHIPHETIAEVVRQRRFRAVTDFAEIAKVDAVLICVPTPLTRHREPDLSYITGTTRSIAPHLKPGHLIVLESTTYPGTTREVMLPILERGGLKSGRDFFLGYSPEREDPGNTQYSTTKIPKVVGGDGADALALVTALYDQFVSRTVPVSSCETAEAVKLTENIFRAVNIALVNELKMVYEAMGIDVWEVIRAASTKPFGFMPFYPGPGLGGHCIPIDPFYLTWKAREYDISTRFIELAGEINTGMPRYVIERLQWALDEQAGKGLKGARILILGVAYKKNVADLRESPTLKIMELLEARGASFAYHDPYVPEITPSREHPEFAGRRSVPLTEATARDTDAAIICTDHDDVDYRLLVQHCPLVVDTRNACARAGVAAAHVIKA
ncbi:MAG TPA: nucleotide sugar dehydrogenase [Stellaceae bacterium]|nr:nucleotide sugar dehydrogenase [Stellaceae bacterium]